MPGSQEIWPPPRLACGPGGRTFVAWYRNTKQILQTASLIAADLLSPEDRDDDGIPIVRPISYGREGAPPTILRLPTLRDEADRIAELLKEEHDSGGRSWAALLHGHS